jgi:hypothetical protein
MTTEFKTIDELIDYTASCYGGGSHPMVQEICEAMRQTITEVRRIYQVLNEVSGNNYAEGLQDFEHEVVKTLSGGET